MVFKIPSVEGQGRHCLLVKLDLSISFFMNFLCELHGFHELYEHVLKIIIENGKNRSI